MKRLGLTLSLRARCFLLDVVIQKVNVILGVFFIQRVSFFICLFITTQTIFAIPTAADELAQLLNNIHVMQASFEQSLVNQHGKRIGTKTLGRMVCERPGKFRWETLQPNNQLIIINKDKMFLYDPDLAQLMKRKVDYSKPGNPAILLSSPVESLKQGFQIAKLKKHGQGLWFKLIPRTQKNQESGYQWIKIHFIGGRLDTMYIFDNLEQTALINFYNIVLNTEIPLKTFTFNPPPNTEIFNSE